MISSGGVNAMLVSNDFPELGTDLVAAPWTWQRILATCDGFYLTFNASQNPGRSGEEKRC